MPQTYAVGMSIFHPRFLTVVVALLALSASTTLLAADKTAAPRNVLFISVDDLRAEIGAFGSTRALTPNIDHLAARGVKFDRAYTQYPLCNPSRASLLTGRYPTTSEIYGNRDWFGGWYPDWVSLPKYFKQHGYQTIRHGKIFHGDLIDDADAWTVGGVPTPLADQKKPANVNIPRANEEQMRVDDKPGTPKSQRSDRWEAVENAAQLAKLGDTVTTDRAIAFLKSWKRGDAPFFLGFGLGKPHSPLVAPKEFFDKYDPDQIELPPDFADRPTVPEGFPAGSIRAENSDLFVGRPATPEGARSMIRAYLACVSYVDWNIGRILAALDKTNLAKDTIVVFWSDHGYQLGEKGKWSKAGSLWEQGTRVPLIVHDPRVKGNGHASPRVVQLLDLYPTLTRLAGLPAPEGLEGNDLRPLLDDPQTSWKHPAYTVWNEHGRGITGIVIRDERWRYAEFFGVGAGAFLTDSINDPYELKNLVNDPRYADVIAQLSALARAKVAGKTEPSTAQ